MDHWDPRLTLRWRGSRGTKLDVVGVAPGVILGDTLPSDSGSVVYGTFDMASRSSRAKVTRKYLRVHCPSLVRLESTSRAHRNTQQVTN